MVKVLLNDREIKDIIINQESNMDDNTRPTDFMPRIGEMDSTGMVPKDIFEYYDKLDQDDDSSASKKVKLFLLEINKEKIEVLQKRWNDLNECLWIVKAPSKNI